MVRGGVLCARRIWNLLLILLFIVILLKLYGMKQVGWEVSIVSGMAYHLSKVFGSGLIIGPQNQSLLCLA